MASWHHGIKGGAAEPAAAALTKCFLPTMP